MTMATTFTTALMILLTMARAMGKNWAIKTWQSKWQEEKVIFCVCSEMLQYSWSLPRHWLQHWHKRNSLTDHILPDLLPEREGESRGVAVFARRGGAGQAEAEDGGHRDEEEGQGGEEEGKLNQDFAIMDCLNIIMNALIIYLHGNHKWQRRKSDFQSRAFVCTWLFIWKMNENATSNFWWSVPSLRKEWSLPSGSPHPIPDSWSRVKDVHHDWLDLTSNWYYSQKSNRTLREIKIAMHEKYLSHHACRPRLENLFHPNL